MRRRAPFALFFVSAVVASTATAHADVALLLFDGEKGRTFAGCLNCNRFEDAAVCNKFGDYGSKFSEKSIWNQFGQFGSKFETNSPWNKFGEGLRVVDAQGNYYGRFTISMIDRSRLKLVEQIVAAHEAVESLDQLQEMLCGG
jgi:hypothetical protein